MSPEYSGSTSRHWRLQRQRYQLLGEVCNSSECGGTKIFPPRDICPDCGQETKEIFKFSGKGEVYSFTTVYAAPAGHKESAPYPVALIRLEEGPMLTAQLTDFGHEEPYIGMQVEMVTRKLKAEGERGQLVYGYKFRPALNSPSLT